MDYSEFLVSKRFHLAGSGIDVEIKNLGIDCYQLVDADGTISKWAVYTAAELVELHTQIGRMIVADNTLLSDVIGAHETRNWTAEEILQREG